MPPGWLAGAVQLHWPLVLEHVVVVLQPRIGKRLAILEHSVRTDETVRHALLNGNLMEPFVTVLSAYVPSELAVHVPVTSRDPVIGTELHPIPRIDTSMFPDKVRHDDVTFQVPTTLPPQEVPLGHWTGWVVLPELPPLAGDPPLPEAPPDWLPPDWLPPEPPFAVVPPEPPPGVEVEHAEPRIQSAGTMVRSKARCDMDSPRREHAVREGCRCPRSLHERRIMLVAREFEFHLAGVRLLPCANDTVKSVREASAPERLPVPGLAH